MYKLLLSIEQIHKNNIIHRDIKPDNFLFDFNSSKCLLIDFGLSDYDFLNDKKINVYKSDDEDIKTIYEIQKNSALYQRIGTKGFLAPEIIFGSKNQGKQVDIWAAGVIFLCFLAKRMPVFNLNKFSKIQNDTIREIEPLIIVFGIKNILDIAKKHDCLMYIPENFNKYTLPNNLENIIERKDIEEVNLIIILGWH